MLAIVFSMCLAGAFVASLYSGSGYVGNYSCKCEECNRHSAKLRKYNEHHTRWVAIAAALLAAAVVSGIIIFLMEAGVKVY